MGTDYIESAPPLPGILMSAADASVKQTVIAGPEGLYQYLASCRTFVQR